MTEPPDPLIRRFGRSALELGVLVNFLFWNIAWIFDIPHAFGREWNLFRDTGMLVLSGRTAELYPGITERLPFLYPPFFAVIVTPLALLPRPAAYLLISATTVGAMTITVLTLQRAFHVSIRELRLPMMIVLGSASWVTMLAVGHLASLFLMLVCLGLTAWMRNQPWRAGAALSVLMIKPQLGIAFPLIMVMRRQWAALAGWLLGMGALALSTLPLGLGVWRDFIRALGSFSTRIPEIPTWKQQTLHASLRSVLGGDHATVVTVIWLLCTVPLVALVALAWWRHRPTPRLLPRLFGMTLLVIVMGTPYLFHYDALLLALPGLVWHFRSADYRSRRLHRLAGGAIAFVYLWQQITIWYAHDAWSLVGFGIFVWLGAELYDLLGATAKPVASSQSSDAQHGDR